MIASMTVGKDVRYVVVPCQGGLGQTMPEGCPDSLLAPVFRRCLRGVFVLAFISGEDQVNCWPQLYLLLWEENICVSVAIWQAGACLALVVIWLKEDWSGCQINLLGLLPLPSSVTKTKQKPPLSLYGRGSVSLPLCL